MVLQAWLTIYTYGATGMVTIFMFLYMTRKPLLDYLIEEAARDGEMSPRTAYFIVFTLYSVLWPVTVIVFVVEVIRRNRD